MEQGAPVEFDERQKGRVVGFSHLQEVQGLSVIDHSEEGPTGFVLGSREIKYLRDRIGSDCSHEDELALVEWHTGLRGKHAEDFLNKVTGKKELMIYLAGRIIPNIVLDDPESQVEDLPEATQFERGMHVGANEIRYMFDLGDKRPVRPTTWDSALAGEVTGLGEDKAREWGLRAALKTNFMLGLVGKELLLRQQKAQAFKEAQEVLSNPEVVETYTQYAGNVAAGL